MLAAFAWRIRVRYRSRVTRAGKQSSGIQFAPRTQIGSPLMTSWNRLPMSSWRVSSSTVRKPMGCSQASRSASPAHSSTRSAERGCAPSECGHQVAAFGTSSVKGDRAGIGAGRALRERRRRSRATTRSGSGSSPTRSSSTWTSTRPVDPAMDAVGRTDDRRATELDSIHAGRQMPAPGSCGPQSQPKLQAIVRTRLNGSR